MRSTGWTRVCKCSQPSLPPLQPLPALQQTPSVAGGDPRSCGAAQHPIKPQIFHEGIFCSSTLAAGGTGPWDSTVIPASPGALSWDLGVSQVIKTSSTESLNSLFPCLGKQELLWLCYRGVCRSACLKSLQTWLWVPTEQTFPCSAPLPLVCAEGERWEVEPGAIPSPSLMEILGRDRIFLAKPLYINSQPRLPLLQGLAEGEAAEQSSNFSTHTTHKYLP